MAGAHFTQKGSKTLKTTGDMWTETTVHNAVKALQKRVDEIVSSSNDGAKQESKASHGFMIDGEDNIRSFCNIEVVHNRLDSPCFRMGSGEKMLHSYNTYANGTYGDGKAVVRSVKRGRFIVCYATCCNSMLVNGCRRCDRLAESSQITEDHFINETERPPIRLGSVDELVKILCMVWAGRRLYNEYHKSQHDHNNNITITDMLPGLFNELKDMYDYGDVNQRKTHMQDSFKALKKHMQDGHDLKREALGVGITQSMKEYTEELDVIHKIKRVCDTGTDTELCEVIEHAKGLQPPLPLDGNANRNKIKREMGKRKRDNFVKLAGSTKDFPPDGILFTHDKKYHDIQRSIADSKEKITGTFGEMCEQLKLNGMKKRLRVECTQEASSLVVAKLLLYSYDQ